MAITSADINNQSFSIDRKGYDVDEVDVFLEFVAEEIDTLNATIARQQVRIAELEEAADVADEQAFAPAYAAEPEVIVDEEPEIEAEPVGDLPEAQARIAELESMLEARKLDDSAISKALIAAQRSAEQIIAQANDEAAQIVQDAEDDADRIIENAEKEKQKISNVIRQLEDERDDAREEYHGILTDFITDASKKLANLETAMAAAAQGSQRAARAARIEQAEDYAAAPVQVEPEQVVTNQVPVRQESAGIAMSYTTPQMDASVTAAANPTASVVEKDFSGFGDVEDDFEFGDID